MKSGKLLPRKVGPETRRCPACAADWQASEIPPEQRQHYGNRTHYSRVVGVEVQGYDGVSFWECPDCCVQWERWTGKRVVA